MSAADLARSEWTKLRSVRSTYWTALVAALATVAVAVIVCWRMAALINGHRASAGDLDGAATFSLTGVYIAQVAIGTLGVLVISAEYGTGMIRATLTAVPQRLAVLAAKGAVFGLAALLVGELMSFTAFGLGQALLGDAHVGVSLADPGALRVVTGAGLYLTLVGLLGFAMGALVRHTAGALAAFLGLLFAPSAVIDLLPSSWHDAINYMPANAGSQIFAVQRTSGALAPWSGFGVLAGYVVVVLAGAAVLMVRRDV